MGFDSYVFIVFAPSVRDNGSTAYNPAPLPILPLTVARLFRTSSNGAQFCRRCCRRLEQSSVPLSKPESSHSKRALEYARTSNFLPFYPSGVFAVPCSASRIGTYDAQTFPHHFSYSILYLLLTLQGRPEDKNVYSTPNSEWQPLEAFESGQEIEINIAMVYYHWVRNERPEGGGWRHRHIPSCVEVRQVRTLQFWTS